MPLPGSRRSLANRVRLVMLVVAILSLISGDLARPSPILAKDFDVIGTVDCGIPSGKRCSLDDTLVLLTDSVTGQNELIPIDIRWVKGDLPALDQDDEITLSVEMTPSGKLRALSIISAKKRDGTVNQGASTDSRDVMESRRDREEDEDDDPGFVRPIGGGVSGTVVNQLTGAPIPGATVRLNGHSATTDAAGFFSILVVVEPGAYQIEASAPLFFPQSQPLVIQSAQTASVVIPLQPQPGVLTGVVRSLLTGTPIPGATVRLNGFTTTTDAAGAFGLGSIPPGAYQVEASAPGFITQTQPVIIQTAQPAQLTFLLATAFPNLTFTLTWGAQPTDLDAHLSGPSATPPPPRFHAYFQDQNPETYVSLLADVQTGFGPEQIVVRRDPVTNQYAAGEYRFWVDNPNLGVSPNYTGSQARVIVNVDAQLLGVFEVSAASGDPNSRLWHVVNVQIDAAGNATAQPIQQFTNGNDFTVLSPPYGGKPYRR